MTAIFALAYALALFILAIGTFGWFGQDRDPLSGIFLMPLGLPWTQLRLSLSEEARLWFAILAPAVNLAILWLLCRALRCRST